MVETERGDSVTAIMRKLVNVYEAKEYVDSVDFSNLIEYYNKNSY